MPCVALVVAWIAAAGAPLAAASTAVVANARDHGLTVRWEAFVADDGGRFVLREVRGGHSRVLAERPAPRGIRTYSLEIEVRGSEQRLELSYVFPDGTQRVLQTAMVQLASVQIPALSLTRYTPDAAQTPFPAWNWLAAGDVAPTAVGRPTPATAEPEIPPPIA